MTIENRQVFCGEAGKQLQVKALMRYSYGDSGSEPVNVQIHRILDCSDEHFYRARYGRCCGKCEFIQPDNDEGLSEEI